MHVKIGKSVKFDDYGRVTVPSDLAKMMNLEKGIDSVVWYVGDGMAIMYKDTKSYQGLDFEGEEIENNLRNYEREATEQFIDDADLSPEELERKLREEYHRDQEMRAELIKSKKGGKSEE